ncbi:MAG: hypothetical protein IBJ00_06810 [Alphaproteobacteria bacterium]|nr:hypothetical protein [Alphaproteobacteria bacterium]
MPSLIPFLSSRPQDPFTLLKRDFSQLLEDLAPSREISLKLRKHAFGKDLTFVEVLSHRLFDVRCLEVSLCGFL